VSFGEAIASGDSRVQNVTGEQRQLTLGEKVAKWQFEHPDPETARSRYPKDIEEDLKDDEDDEDFDDKSELPELGEAVVFLFQSEAFKDLQSRMGTESQLSSREGEIIQFIRTKVLSSFKRPGSQVHNHVLGLMSRTAMISIPNLKLFLQEQYPGIEPPNIEDVITITGGPRDAQATTCGIYVRQVWPLIGEGALNALQSALCQAKQEYSCKAPEPL
jgi:hypothetical protein